jgi:hypothetical protein
VALVDCSRPARSPEFADVLAAFVKLGDQTHRLSNGRLEGTNKLQVLRPQPGEHHAADAEDPTRDPVPLASRWSHHAGERHQPGGYPWHNPGRVGHSSTARLREDSRIRSEDGGVAA